MCSPLASNSPAKAWEAASSRSERAAKGGAEHLPGLRKANPSTPAGLILPSAGALANTVVELAKVEAPGNESKRLR